MSAAWALAGGAAIGFAAGWFLAARRYRKGEQMRARFLSFVAHEINSPITSLNMTILNLVRGVFGEPSEEHRPWLVMIREQTARLTDLIGDMRDLIHSEFHRDLRLTFEPVDIGELLSETLETMKDSLARIQAEVELRVPEDLPRVRGDGDRLSRVISAMLNHARKFRTKGFILVIGDTVGGDVRLSVEYNGLKAPHEDIRDALDLFYPVLRPESQVLAGVGLGLGLPRRLIEEHGGSMSFDVDEGDRYRITFRVPKSSGAGQ